ncbi:MAG: thioredoxin family protein [Planctomycetaceae bacterium]|nr:thioredoxin family protein [Planctomycetaceae bacterium]
MQRVFLALTIVALFSPVALAGKYNKVLSIGDAAPDWKNLEGTDGEKRSLADFADKEIVVLAFTCNSCPYATDHEERLNTLHARLTESGKGVVIAINPNQVKDDLLPAMKSRVDARGLKYLYLHDATQEVAKNYGATYTPEFVVLNKDRKVVYLGAMDDSPELKKPVTKKYVEDAIAASLSGKSPEVTETPSVGCLVRYAKVRRKQD